MAPKLWPRDGEGEGNGTHFDSSKGSNRSAYQRLLGQRIHRNYLVFNSPSDPDPPLIALAIIIPSVLYAFLSTTEAHVLTFLGTLCGAVTGFYFGGKMATTPRSTQSQA